jgi:hypothetical protein
MATSNVAKPAAGELPSVTHRGRGVPRKRKTVKEGEQVHLSVMIESKVVKAIDSEAERMTAADPMKRQTTRTDVVRHWLRQMADQVSKK